MAEHQCRLEVLGIDDEKSWQTYALFLPFDHWQRTLGSRYNKTKRVKHFAAKRDKLIAEVPQPARTTRGLAQWQRASNSSSSSAARPEAVYLGRVSVFNWRQVGLEVKLPLE